MRNDLSVMSVCLLMAATATQARDWGFSKDTVYEYDVSYEPHRPAFDTVHLMNEGRDSLNIDSAWIEVVEPENSEEYFGSFLVGLGSFQDFPDLRWPNSNWPKNYFWLKSEKNLLTDLYFTGGLKNQLNRPSSNRIVLRSVFRAKGRSYDTLMVVGDYLYCFKACPTNATLTTHRKKPSSTSKRKPFQVDGRRLTKPSR